MAQQTAVELLEKKLKTYLSWSSFLEEDFEQAKQMEKEQIVKAVSVGYDYCEDGKVRWMGEQYYNETYGKE